MEHIGEQQQQAGRQLLPRPHETTLFLHDKHGCPPLVVFEIEHIQLLAHALLPKLRHLAMDYYNLFIRSLTATRSINGALIKELTQTKVRYEYDDVKGKKGINKMFAPKGDKE